MSNQIKTFWFLTANHPTKNKCSLWVPSFFSQVPIPHECFIPRNAPRDVFFFFFFLLHLLYPCHLSSNLPSHVSLCVFLCTVLTITFFLWNITTSWCFFYPKLTLHFPWLPSLRPLESNLYPVTVVFNALHSSLLKRLISTSSATVTKHMQGAQKKKVIKNMRLWRSKVSLGRERFAWGGGESKCCSLSLSSSSFPLSVNHLRRGGEETLPN